MQKPLDSTDISFAAINPIVTIGLPVYNGELFLKETLEAILQQTFENFELIISDNASTDATEKICRSYALKDGRIKYIRNEKNLGAAKNYNQLVPMARGKYFKWAAADDLIAPSYLTQCVNILNGNPDILICQSAIRIIDERGQHLRDYDDHLHFGSEEPHLRLHNYLFRKAGMWNAVFGLIRVEELRKTQLIGGYISSDQVLLGELVLRGKVFQIPERLFSRRVHPQQAGGAYKNRAKAKIALAAWFDPENNNKYVLPVYLQHFFSYLAGVYRAPLDLHEKLLCSIYILKWYLHKMIGTKVIRFARKLSRPTAAQ